MLKIDLAYDGWQGRIASTDKKDPRPFLMPGVRVKFAAIGIKAVRAARRAVAAALKIDADDVEEAGDALSRELIRRGIEAWEGVVDKADNTPLPVTPELVARVVANPDFFEAADDVYVFPWVLRGREGNASPVSPNGTGEAGTVAGATARRRASKKPASAAKSARTSTTPSKRAKAKKSGAS